MQLPEADFTRDQFATEASSCERCKTFIRPGGFRGFVKSARPTHPGMYCCKNCFEYYRGQSISRQPEMKLANNPSPAGIAVRLASGSVRTVDIHGIRSSVNASQRQGHTSLAGRVTALPHVISAQGVPSLTNPGFDYGRGSAASGYTSNHASYQKEREHWAHKAHMLDAARASLRPKVSINVFLCGGNAPKFVQTNYCEGILVDQDATGRAIHDAVLNCLRRHLSETFPELPINFSDVTVRHRQSWVSVLEKANEQWWAANYEEKKKGGMRFVTPPVKQREFCLVFSAPTWQAMQDYKENMELGCSLEKAQYLFEKAQRKVGQHLDGESTLFSQYLDGETEFEDVPTVPLQPSNKIHSKTKRTRLTETDPWELPPWLPPKKKAKARAAPDMDEGALLETPGIHKSEEAQGAEELGNPIIDLTTDDSSTLAKPQVAVAPHGVRQTRLRLGRPSIHAAISNGGQLARASPEMIVGGLLNERITAYPILVLTFAEVVQRSNNPEEPLLPFSIDPSSGISGILSYKRVSELGRGGTKSAFAATFKPAHASPDGKDPLYPANSWKVVLKRPFRQSRSPPTVPVPLARLRWFNGTAEATMVLKEGITLAWATALLQLAYEFIDAELTKRQEKPPFPIPRLRMVVGFIATCDKDNSKAPGLGASTLQGTYLLEEMILTGGKPFRKYINNDVSCPVMQPGEDGYETAVFLCFLQHVQYIETEGAAFTSDFQGGETVLTDPQIISDPSLGNDLFSGGNVKECFYDFPIHHKCNKFCDWFGLEPPEIINPAEYSECFERVEPGVGGLRDGSDSGNEEHIGGDLSEEDADGIEDDCVDENN